MIKTIFTKYLFLLLVLYVIVALSFSDFSTYGVNKTVGWAYDISDLNFLIGLTYSFSILLFLIGYGILAILKRKTIFLISVVHFAIIIFSIFFDKIGVSIITLSLFIVSIGLFIINLIKSYK